MPYLDATVLLPPQLDFTKLALTNGVSENEVAKFGGSLVATTVVVPTPTSSPLLGCSGHADHRWRRRVIVLGHIAMVRSSRVVSAGFFGVGDDPIQVITGVSWRLGGRGLVGFEWASRRLRLLDGLGCSMVVHSFPAPDVKSWSSCFCDHLSGHSNRRASRFAGRLSAHAAGG